MLWCEIVSFQTKSTFICLFYRPHSTGVEYMESLRDSLTLLKCKNIQLETMNFWL